MVDTKEMDAYCFPFQNLVIIIAILGTKIMFVLLKFIYAQKLLLRFNHSTIIPQSNK